MKPTQISTIVLIPLSLVHAYQKQNAVFYYWLLVLVSSVMHHFTKFDYPKEEREKTLAHHFDIVCVVALNLFAVQEIYQHTQPTMYFATGWSVYAVAIGMFVIGKQRKVLKFDPDEATAELCHAMWHVIPHVVTHMFLFVYQKA